MADTIAMPVLMGRERVLPGQSGSGAAPPRPYLMPTYLEFRPFGLELVRDLASLPDAEVRDGKVKFSHIKSAKSALDAAKLYMQQSRQAGG